jgi:glycosyltransferase involved in cell wall biosynthesis
MPRLFILCEYSTLLGGERSMLTTLPALTAAGFDVEIASPPVGALAGALKERGVSHWSFHTHDDCGERLPLVQLRTVLAALLQRIRPQLVHGNSLSMSRIAGPVAAQCGLASVGHLRDIVKLSKQAIDDLNFQRVLIAVSNATRDFHVAQGLDARRCVVAYNGIDLEQFHPRQATGYLHRELRLPPSARLIAVIGQIGLRKGMDVALQAATKVVTEVPDVHWLIVGERTSGKDESFDFERRLHDAANEPPLAGRVHFLGQRADVRDLLAECVLLVHPARQEPLGRVLLEAAATGLPVIATDVGGTLEIFPTESDGAVLVPSANAAAIAHEAIALLRDDQRRLAIGAAGRRRAQRQFDIRHTSARLLQIYQSVLT